VRGGVRGMRNFLRDSAQIIGFAMEVSQSRAMSQARRHRLRPAGSPEAPLSVRSSLRLRRASVVQPRPISHLSDFGRPYRACFRYRSRDCCDEWCSEAGLFGQLHARGLCPWSRGSNSNPKRARLHFTACHHWCDTGASATGDVVWVPCNAA
jgi:hypothetical protein